MIRFPAIDYSVHPAFIAFPKLKHDLSSVLLPSFVELDNLINEFDGNGKIYNEAEISDFYNKTVFEIISIKIKKIIDDEYDFNLDSKSVMLNSIPSLLTKLYDQSVYNNIRKGYKISNLSTKGKMYLMN
jgi:hypothetical protein